MRRISVKLRVTVWYTLVMIIVATVVFAAMRSISREMTERDISQKITRSVDELPRRMFSPGGRFSLPPDFNYYERGVYYLICDDSGSIIGGQLPYESDETNFEDGSRRIEKHGGKEYYIYDKRFEAPNHTAYRIKGVISMEDETYLLDSAAKNNLALTVVLIFAAAIGGYFIISRAFVPVNKISRTAKEISESTDLSRRIDIGSGSDEICELANTFDDMLDKIEESFEKEKQFTSDASHELRTPVAVILSECEYMEECAKSIDDYKESVCSVKRQAERMSRLISELLTISRMDKNTIRINAEQVDLSELLRFVCDEQEEINTGSSVMLKKIEKNIIASVDRDLMARLFINLISNAYRYGGENGTVTVSLSQKDENVCFCVEDTGIGIDEKDINKIWERFYRADASRSADENGSTGLGLSIVKWIAEKHGGTATVESKPGEGSKFTFIFPKNPQEI